MMTVEKENMRSVLKGVAVYKGIEDYLSHIGDADKKYVFNIGGQDLKKVMYNMFWKLIKIPD